MDDLTTANSKLILRKTSTAEKATTPNDFVYMQWNRTKSLLRCLSFDHEIQHNKTSAFFLGLLFRNATCFTLLHVYSTWHILRTSYFISWRYFFLTSNDENKNRAYFIDWMRINRFICIALIVKRQSTEMIKYLARANSRKRETKPHRSRRNSTEEKWALKCRQSFFLCIWKYRIDREIIKRQKKNV